MNVTMKDLAVATRAFGIACVALAGVVSLTLVAGSAAASSVPSPTVIGPIPVNVPLGHASHDYPQYVAAIDYASLGYVEEEYFFEGLANRYTTPPLATGTLSSSGHPYRSRLIVRRPMSPATFNGTVLVEWVNVTSGYNNDAMFKASTDHLLRAGYAYVGVSAQRVGIHGPAGLRSWSPIRYSTLDVTHGDTILDDSLSYDIFSQAAQAIRHPSGIDILGGLPVQRIFAIGASQSQGRLVIYHNSIHPLAGVYDAFFLFLGLGGRLRTDLDVKVFKVDTETDILFLGEVAARQPDSETLRTWEVAGTSHVGFSGFANRVALTVRDGLPVPDPSPCDRPALSHVPTYQVLNAVYDHLVRWVADGSPPPTAPRIELTSAGPPVVVARDSHGNALGGVQLSQHAVPTAVNDGINSGPGFCFLYGSHRPFDDATLAQLYRNHGAYVSAVSHVNNDNVAAGYILREDAEANKQAAAQSEIGKKKR
jgi:hypothetical protein